MSDLISVFGEYFETAQEVQTTFCPYRICPMGAHSDHQYGLVTGLAIDKGIEIAYVPTDDGAVELISLNFSGAKSFSLFEIPEKQSDWADYLRGAVFALSAKYKPKIGLKCLVSGSLPVGGLSSSAAVIIAFLSALCKVNDIRLQKSELIDIALCAERDYVGINVGKLDQSCEVLSKKDHLLFLDTKTDTYELIPKNPDMKPFEIAVFFSGVERTLVGSAFNTRVDELKAASYALKAFSGMEYNSFKDSRLRDVPNEVYEHYKDRLPENWRKRAEHFYSEFERVKKGAQAWRNGDIEAFGRLSSESGYSSIYNYETGSPELKTLYDIMMQTRGIYGGRFSGAGFKGCCMALINPECRDEIEKTVTEKYLAEFPALTGKFSVHFCESADGCR